MAKGEFWNDLGNELRIVNDEQLTRERWFSMDMVGKGNTVAILGAIGTGVALGLNHLIEYKAGESWVGKIAKGVSRVAVAGGVILTAGGVWYAAEGGKALGLVINERKRRSAYLGTLSQEINNQVIDKSVEEGLNGRGAYLIAKEMMGAK